MPAVRARLKAVREFRKASTSVPTRAMAATPARFHVTVVPDRPFLVVPESSSERRDYVPIGRLEPPTVPSSLVRVILDADTPAQKARVSALAHAVLTARAAFAGATLVDLYDRDSMPTPLRRAHAALDAAVDRLYHGAAFATDRERLEFLFALYECLSSPMTSAHARGSARPR